MKQIDKIPENLPEEFIPLFESMNEEIKTLSEIADKKIEELLKRTVGIPEDLPSKFLPRFTSLINENENLKEQLSAHRRIQFCRRSERYVGNYIIEPDNTLFNEAEELDQIQEKLDEIAEKQAEEKTEEQKEETNQKPAPHNKKPTKKSAPTSFPSSLPRVDKFHDCKEKICPYDNTPLIQIGTEKVEKLDIIPAKMQVTVHHYPKYACPCCEQHVKQEKAEPSILPGSQAEPGLLAHIIMNKYHWCLPLYRQEEIFSKNEVSISRSTLARWVIACGEKIEPLVNLLKASLFEKPVLQCDETPVKVLNSKKSPTSPHYMFVMSSPLSPAVVYQYSENRNQESAKNFLAGFKGYLQVDGYSGYNAYFKENPLLTTRVGCWAHARRKFESAFVDGAPHGKSKAQEFLDLIKELFLLERERKKLPLEERFSFDTGKFVSIVDKINKLLIETREQAPPRSKLGTAINYLHNEWEYLTAFLKDYRIELSNNLVENAIRPFAIGRKNWLFSSTAKGATASANLYSIVCSAKRCGLPIEDYLAALFEKIPTLEPDNLKLWEDLLPWNWKEPSPT